MRKRKPCHCQLIIHVICYLFFKFPLWASALAKAIHEQTFSAKYKKRKNVLLHSPDMLRSLWSNNNVFMLVIKQIYIIAHMRSSIYETLLICTR